MINIAPLPDDISRAIWKQYFTKHVLRHVRYAAWGYHDTFIPMRRLLGTGKFAWESDHSGIAINYQELAYWSDYRP